MRKSYILILATVLMLPYFVYPKEKFEWDPITEADWSVTEDSARGIYNATMLFEKIVADERKLKDEKCYLTIYRRIKVFNAEGRKWGDEKVPYLHKKQKIEEIKGRTIYPDGKVIPLSESQIFEKEIFKTKGIKIKQKSFSLPGLTDDCIIEYCIKYRLPTYMSIWLIQKEIFLTKGIYVWKFYRGLGLSDWVFNAIKGEITPNFLWLNANQEILVEKRPSLKNPEEVVFTTNNVPVFESEPYSMPDIALKAQIRFYYGKSGTADAYWGDISRNKQELLTEFTQKNNKVREIVKNISSLETKNEKINAAYSWLQENIYNTTYDDSNKKYKDNKTVNDIFKRSYGTDDDINKAFYDMLREMNIDARFVYVTDSDDNFFAPQAKYWQFDRSLVAVPADDGKYKYYMPGAKYLPPGNIPWFNECNAGFLIGDVNKLFVAMPHSKPHSNRIQRTLMLTMDENLQLSGKLIENYSGQSAYSLRIHLSEATEKERRDYLQEQLEKKFPNSKIDSIIVKDLKNLHKNVKVLCNVKITSTGQQMGDLLLLKPYDLFSRQEMLSPSEIRKFPIVFDYAKQIVEILKIELPEKWLAEALPSDSSFDNIVGNSQIIFNIFVKTLSIQRMFRLNNPLWKASDYVNIRKLFQAQQAFESITVVLRKEKNQ